MSAFPILPGADALPTPELFTFRWLIDSLTVLGGFALMILHFTGWGSGSIRRASHSQAEGDPNDSHPGTGGGHGALWKRIDEQRSKDEELQAQISRLREEVARECISREVLSDLRNELRNEIEAVGRQVDAVERELSRVGSDATLLKAGVEALTVRFDTVFREALQRRGYTPES